MENIKHIRYAVVVAVLWLASFKVSKAQDLVVLGGTYDMPLYDGYKQKGVYLIQISKTDSYTFTEGQFEINVSLPPQGPYDPSRASEVVLPQGWEMIVAQNPDGSYDNGSFILRLKPGAVYAGSGPGINRRRDFYIPIITTAAGNDEPTLVTVQWNDFEVYENPVGNSGGSVLNVKNVPLPVKLINFVAGREGRSTLLKWSTTEETNSDRFEIERSHNGKSWKKIGVVTSHGESATLRSYSFPDSEPADGENLYRLKMVDKDQTFAYSRIQNVTFGEDATVAVYPNPVSDHFSISTDWSKVKEVSLVDGAGRQIYSGSTERNIDVKNLVSGLYVVCITYRNGEVKNRKVIVNR